MNAEFSWWLLIVGLVLGAALTWLVMAESTRTDADLTETEQRGEALWIASVLTSSGRPTEDASVEEILQLHREYLAAPPPDDPSDPPVTTATTDAAATAAATEVTATTGRTETTEAVATEVVAPAERAPVSPEER